MVREREEGKKCASLLHCYWSFEMLGPHAYDFRRLASHEADKVIRKRNNAFDDATGNFLVA